MRVQWTRLPGALPTPQFVEQIKRLLAAPATPAMEAGRPRPARRDEGGASPVQPVGRRVPAAAAGAMIAMLVGALVVGAIFWRRPAESPAGANAAAGMRPPASEKSAPAAPVANDKSIAVLPFENMSEDKDASAFFADGMHEDLLTNLAYIRDVRVVSRTSVMQYRHTTKPISQIAQELKVAYVLEGSVRRAGNKLRVTGQLIRAATDEHVWAKSYDRDLSDVFAIQTELAQAIAGALQSVLSPETKARLERRPTENTAAYDAYLRARELENAGNYDDPKPQIELLQRAVSLDPAFAAAWADLGALQAFVYFTYEQALPQLALAKTAIDTEIGRAHV